jgi:proteasome lid subunit RPN8/RPN11
MMPDVVRITRDALTAIDAHARSEAPVECCGLLLGRTTTDAEAVAIEALPDSDVTNDEPRGVTLLVEQAIPTRNVAETPTRYLIDPEEHFRILRRTRASDLTIVGAYHSHPITRPVPSPLDLDEALPQFLYLIASPIWEGERSETRAWWLVDGTLCERPLVCVP